MQWLWTHSGASFGYRDGDDLRSHDGRHVGRFYGNEVYGPDGRYLGELRNGRLITDSGKKGSRRGSFTPRPKAGGSSRQSSQGPAGAVGGFEDFPKPERL